MTLKELYSKNKFISKILKDNQVILKKDLKIGLSSKKTWKTKISTKERFVIETFYFITEVLVKLETIDYYLAFLNSYPKTKLWEKTFSRTDYLRYHTESYLNSIIGTFDRSLLLINHLYDLGFKNKDVKYHFIINNKHIKDRKIGKLLRLFNKTLKGVRKSRNFIQHEGRFFDEGLDEAGKYEFIFRHGIKLTGKEKKLYKFVFDLKIRIYLSGKKKEIKENNKKLIKIINIFFDILFDQYVDQLKKFSK